MYDSNFYDAHVLDADECMYTCMMRKSIMRDFFVKDQWTKQLIQGVCVYDAYIYNVCYLILTNVFMMHNV